MAQRALESSDLAPLEALRAARATQRTQERSVRRGVEAAAAARDAAAEEVRALEYVCELTRDEAARRRRGNAHLATAYSGLGGEPPVDDQERPDAVQRTEAALLAAKAELAALRLSIDELHARAERARRRAVRRRANAGPRAARLIADVDGVVTESSPDSDDAAPGRVGVAPAGTLAILGYGRAEPLRRMPAPVAALAIVEPLNEADARALRGNMQAAKVRTADAGEIRTVPNETATVLAIAEALHATISLVNSTSAATTVVDDAVPPPSPKSPRRPLSMI